MADDSPFAAWIELQLELQRDAFVDPRTLWDRPEERSAFILWNAFAACDEIHEAMQECGWKPWATSRHLNTEEFLEELVDALHFIANMVLAAAINQHEDPKVLAKILWLKYQAKVEKNLQRQLEGYDGVQGKCPACKRQTYEIRDDSGVVTEMCRIHGRIVNVTRVQSPEHH
jgi:dUTPase